MLLMLLIPLGIWWISHKPNLSLQPMPSRSCPATTPVLLRDLQQHPERYQHRIIWIQGQVMQEVARCIKIPCRKTSVPCCPPCQAFLSLRQGSTRIALRGRLGARPILCNGTRCDLRCSSLVPGFRYALAGRVRISRPVFKPGRPQYKLKSFWVREGCLLTKKNRPFRRPQRQKDPRHRLPKTQQW